MTTSEQKFQALAHANNIKVERSLWRARVSAMPVEAARTEMIAAIERPPDYLQSMTLEQFFKVMPGVGARIVRRWLASYPTGHTATLGKLTPMRRQWAIDRLRGRPES